MALLDLTGAFSLGVIVAVFLFICYYFYEHKLGAWNSPSLGEASSTICARNVARAFDPMQNSLEVFWRPAVSGIGGSRFGTGKEYTGVGSMLDDEPETSSRWKGLDGLRALAFLWVLAYELNTFLALLDADYSASTWSSGKNEQQFPWKLATQGYLGYGLYLVISSFLFTYANIVMQHEDATSVEKDAPFAEKLWSKYVPIFWRKFARVWPSLAAGVLFLGFLLPKYINTQNSVVEAKFFQDCEESWWTNMFLVANFFEHDCYMDTWAVSLSFQLAFLVPYPAYLFAQGDTKRFWAYILVYAIVVVSLVARCLTVVGFKITDDPLGDGYETNKYWLQRMPWTRAGEYAMGMLVCFSVYDEKEDEPPRFMDIFRLVGEPFHDWMNDLRLLFTTTLQTATIACGFMFMYEGTLQEHKLNFSTDGAGKTAILVFGDLLVASAFGLLLRWSLHGVHGSWLKRLLSWPLWFPVASLSYTGFLFQMAAALWAKNVLEKDCGWSISEGYDYFSAIYFFALFIVGLVAFVVTVCIEKPLFKLAQLRQPGAQ